MISRGPYKIGTLARLTGFSPVLLRAWERRYGFLEPGRGPGGHRLYSDDDLKVLLRIRDLTEHGRSIGEVAALGRGSLLAEAPASGTQAALTLEESRSELVDAALRLDSDRINRTLDAVAASFSPDVVIEGVIEPVAREVGSLWESGRCTVASEHLISSVFRHRMLKLIEAAGHLSSEAPGALAACLPGEEHELGLLMLSYFVNRAGVRVLYLGNKLPLESCIHACEVARPDAVLLSVTIGSSLDDHRDGLVSMAAALPPNVTIFLGGQGAPEADRELERRGIRLIPSPGLSGREVSLRIAGEIRSKRGGQRAESK